MNYSDPGAGAKFNCCCDTECPGRGATWTDPRVADTEVAAGAGAATSTAGERGAGATSTVGTPEASTVTTAPGAGSKSAGGGFD